MTTKTTIGNRFPCGNCIFDRLETGNENTDMVVVENITLIGGRRFSSDLWWHGLPTDGWAHVPRTHLPLCPQCVVDYNESLPFKL